MKIESFRKWLLNPLRRPLVMGVLNVTPDSFSDGGKLQDAEAAVREAVGMVAAGAEMLDIGGESTRPGSLPVEPAEQIRRVVPVVREIVRQTPGVVISVDTTSAAVAEAALDVGAHMINDISALRHDPDLLPVVARWGVPVVLMHMKGAPRTMQENPTYTDVVGEVKDFLVDRVQHAIDGGMAAENVLIDPGIGFGKTMAHNLELLRRLPDLASLGRPMLVGTSRKKFIGIVTGEPEPARRVFGTAASVAWAVANGAAIVRVHDVGPMAQVVAMVSAIQRGPAADGA